MFITSLPMLELRSFSHAHLQIPCIFMSNIIADCENVIQLMIVCKKASASGTIIQWRRKYKKRQRVMVIHSYVFGGHFIHSSALLSFSFSSC